MAPRGRQNAMMLSLVSESVGISISVTAPSPQAPIGSIHALGRTVEELMPHYGPECPAAVVFRASWPDERVVRATLATIAAEVARSPIERTAVILVGRALGAADFRDSALYDAAYQRRFRGRSG